MQKIQLHQRTQVQWNNLLETAANLEEVEENMKDHHRQYKSSKPSNIGYLRLIYTPVVGEKDFQDLEIIHWQTHSIMMNPLSSKCDGDVTGPYPETDLVLNCNRSCLYVLMCVPCSSIFMHLHSLACIHIHILASICNRLCAATDFVL
jgi:hypothetical protein